MMNGLKIGLASVTFRDKSVREVVEIARKSGVEYIEWGADVHVKTPDEAKLAKELCDLNGIKISSYGSYYRAGECNKSEWERICRNSSVMGASSVRIWLGNKDSEITDADEYKLILNDCKSLCAVAKEYGLIVSPECHDNTFNNNTDAFLKLAADLNEPNFKTYFQSRYFKFEYDIDRIERTFDYIENVHVSYRDLKLEQRFRKKDKKYLDKLLIKLAEMDYNGIVILEFTEKNSEKNFAEDIEKLRKIKLI